MTDIDIHPGVIHRGSGIVARWPGVVAVIPADDAHQAAVEEMFAELGSDPDPADVVRAIRELTIDQSTLTAAAYLMMATGGPMALAHGPVEVLVDGEVILTGGEGPNETQITTGDHFALRSTMEPEASDPLAPSDLRRGVAPGGGISLGGVGLASTNLGAPPPPEHSTAATPVAPNEPDAAPKKIHAPFRSVMLFNADPAQVEARQALPVAAPVTTAPDEPEVNDVTAPKPAGTSTGPLGHPAPTHREPEPTIEPQQVDDDVMVHGIVCSRDHFNNPAAAFCMVCGISMVHVTHNLVPGPRPTLGFVVFDDGSTFGLDRSYLVGREPGETGDPHTAPLTIPDNNETLSRRHAEIRLIEWVVHVVDLSSTNGTFIWDLNYERWNQIGPNQPVALTPGDTVALGRRTFVYESVTRL